MDLGWSHDIWRFLSLCWDFALNTVMYFKIPPSWRLPIFLKTSMICFSCFPPLVSLILVFNESESCSVNSNSLRPHGLYSPGNSPGQNTGVGSLSLLQGISPTQGLNPGLLHCRQILSQLSYEGSPHLVQKTVKNNSSEIVKHLGNGYT